MSQATVQPATATDAHPMTTWNGAEILETLIAALPTPATEWQQKALNTIQSGNYNLCKVYPSLALEDAFVKAIGYMSSIPTVTDKKMPTLATLVTESCRAIADAVYVSTLDSSEDVETARTAQAQTMLRLETANQKIFAKALRGE